MPSRLLRSTSTSSHSSPPASETNSGSTPDRNLDGQSLGARLRRGAQIATSGGVLRRMYSLGMTGQNIQSKAPEPSSNSDRCQQPKHPTCTPPPFVSAAATTTGPAGPGLTASPQPSSVVRENTDTSSSLGSTGAGGASGKWGDLSIYSIFARGPLGELRDKRETGPFGLGYQQDFGASVLASAGNSSVGGSEEEHPARPPSRRVSPSSAGNGNASGGGGSGGAGGGGAGGGGGGGSSSGASKPPVSMRRTESLPFSEKIAPGGGSAKWKPPGNFITNRTTVSELPKARKRIQQPHTVVLSALPPEELPPSPPPPLTDGGAAKASSPRPAERDDQSPMESPRAEALNTSTRTNAPRTSTPPVAEKSSSRGRGGDSAGSENVALGGKSREGGRTRGRRQGSSGGSGSGGFGGGGGSGGGGDDVESLRKKLQALARSYKRLTMRVSRRDQTVS